MMDSDLLLAKSLQERFDHERNSRERQIESKPTNSIIDPQWDLHDPTPDIYALFQMFNAKFFWSKLDSVEVKWSPRMYSCAGVCTYKGLGGCIVSLSLPLLKLRPRKDLIETLLHEMIHAYLFVTDRNSEREEHGPKFHSHMNRINKAAGTNITVYHTFHDEVKHYKTHWWRCNGPCKSRPPFYGLVKRSMNRAPGPNDFWYAEHKHNCGGEFIKVKEPDGFKSRKSKKTLGDKENSKKPASLDKYLSPTHPSQSKVTANIFGMNSLDKKGATKPTTEKLGKTNNVHGFKGLTPTNLTKPSANKNTCKNNGRNGTGGGGGLGLMSNRGGTLVERPRMVATASSSASPKTTTLVQTTFTPYSGTGQILDPNCQPSDINRANSRLLKLYSPVNNVKPSTPSVSTMENPQKKQKMDEDVATTSLLKEDTLDLDANFVNCPVCNKKLLQRQVNEHLDECINLNAIMESISETVIIEDDPIVVEEDQGEPDGQNNNVNCPNCDKIFKLGAINQHLDECLQSF